MATNNYILHTPLSVNGIKHLKENLSFISSNLPQVRRKFMQRSLDYIEQQAKKYIRATTGGSSWYQLTNELENSFMKDPNLGTLINYCGYSA